MQLLQPAVAFLEAAEAEAVCTPAEPAVHKLRLHTGKVEEHDQLIMSNCGRDWFL